MAIRRYNCHILVINVSDVAVGQEACKTVSPSSVCNSTTTTTATSSGGDANDSKCVRPLENNSVSITSGLLLQEVDV